jgi:hypothetical protein
MKPHEPKKQGQNNGKKERGGEQRAIKNEIEKGEKDNKTLSQKNEKGQKKTLTKRQ